jgi:FMN phosphatase YigB (HAD superfamily)
MIDGVIFDLSEVLLPGMIGVEDLLSAKTGLPKDRFTQAMGIFPHYVVGNNLDDLLKGHLSYEQYRDNVLRAVGLPQDDSSLFDATCLSMFDKPYDYTEKMLSTVAAACDIYLLSDHCEAWVRWIEKRHRFIALFKDVVWSYEIGATKRESKPFEEILSRNALKAESCLFVDDLERNIRMARQLGMKTVHFRGRDSIPDVYKEIETANHAVVGTSLRAAPHR